MCHNVLKNAFTFIIYNVVDDNIQMSELPYFVETIVFALSEKNIKIMGEEIMLKLYMNHAAEQLKLCFENELAHSMKLYSAFLDWTNNN